MTLCLLVTCFYWLQNSTHATSQVAEMEGPVGFWGTHKKLLPAVQVCPMENMWGIMRHDNRDLRMLCSWSLNSTKNGNTLRFNLFFFPLSGLSHSLPASPLSCAPTNRPPSLWSPHTQSVCWGPGLFPSSPGDCSVSMPEGSPPNKSLSMLTDRARRTHPSYCHFLPS